MLKIINNRFKRLTLFIVLFWGLIFSAILPIINIHNNYNSIETELKYGAEKIVDKYGRLQVYGSHVCSETGEQITLGGMSFFWSQWAPDYYTADVVDYLVDIMKVSVVRAAYGVEEDMGPSDTVEQIETVVEAAIDRGIYVIIDFHGEGNLLPYEDYAKEFFGDMAQKYGDTPNVIYELYNEPTSQQTTEIQQFCQNVANEIRRYDPDNLIICGSQEWSQHPESYTITDSNAAYTFHGYPDTYGAHLQNFYNNVQAAMDAGSAVFVTEFGANGEQTTNTEEMINACQDMGISMCAWSVHHKDEVWSIFEPNVFMGPLTSWGNYLKGKFENWPGGKTYDYYLLTSTTGGGSVTRSGGYASGESVTIEATADKYWTFDHWEGDLSGNTNPDTIIMNSDKSITAVFTGGPDYYLTTEISGLGSVSPSSSGYASGEIVTIEAIPSDGWTFDHWEGDISGSENPVTITMDSDKFLYAIFTGGPQTDNLAAFKLVKESSAEFSTASGAQTVDLDDTTRWSSLWSVPQWIYVDLVNTYYINEVVINWEDAYANQYQIQVSDDATSWSTVYTESGGNGGIDSISFTPTKARYVRLYCTAKATEWGISLWEFEVYGEEPYDCYLTTAISGLGSVSPSSGGYASGEIVTIEAIPSAGWTFDHWEGDFSGSENPVTITMDSDKFIYAIFTGGPQTDNLAAYKLVTASSIENENFIGSNAVDMDSGTRWASAFNEPEWIYVDLVDNYNINQVVLNWEAAYATAYEIQVSDDANIWSTVYSTTTGDGGLDSISFTPTSARYVRMYGITRAVQYGFSLYEFEVYGDASEFQNGDVNHDGNVDIVDALLIAQFYVGQNPDPFYEEQADVNDDGSIDIVDALLVAQAYVGLIVLPP